MKFAWKELVIGLLVGVIAGGWFMSAKDPFGSWKPGGDRQKFHQRMMDKFTSELQLTHDQQAQVSVILEDTRAKVNALREASRPKFEEIRNASKAQISKLLTPEQNAKFEIMNARMEARREKRRAMKHF